MELFGWLGKRRKDVEQAVPSAPAVRLIKPPVVMTIMESDQVGEITPTQFLQYGWRRGEESDFTGAWDRQLKNAYPLLPDCKIHSMAIPLPNGLWLRAASFVSSRIDSLNLNTVLVLYLPTNIAFKEMPKMDSITGGPTQELSDALRYIALRMESRIISVFTDCDRDEVLVVFKSWAKNYSIYNNEGRWVDSHAFTDTTIKKESDKP